MGRGRITQVLLYKTNNLLIIYYMNAIAVREILSFTCYYVVSVRKGILFLWVLEMGCLILLWHSLSLPYKYCA